MIPQYMTTLLSDVFLYINQFEKKQLYSYKAIAQNHTPLPLKIVNLKLNHTPSGKKKMYNLRVFYQLFGNSWDVSSLN